MIFKFEKTTLGTSKYGVVLKNTGCGKFEVISPRDDKNVKTLINIPLRKTGKITLCVTTRIFTDRWGWERAYREYYYEITRTGRKQYELLATNSYSQDTTLKKQSEIIVGDEWHLTIETTASRKK